MFNLKQLMTILVDANDANDTIPLIYYEESKPNLCFHACSLSELAVSMFNFMKLHLEPGPALGYLLQKERLLATVACSGAGPRAPVKRPFRRL